jgi:hypothetical protein
MDYYEIVTTSTELPEGLTYREICEYVDEMPEYGELVLKVPYGSTARHYMNRLSANMAPYMKEIALPKDFVLVRRVINTRTVGIYLLPGTPTKTKGASK